jgi:hypothetical protein
MPVITRAKNVVVMTIEEERALEKADWLARSLAWHSCQATAVLPKNNGDLVEPCLRQRRGAPIYL